MESGSIPLRGSGARFGAVGFGVAMLGGARLGMGYSRMVAGWFDSIPWVSG